MAARATLSSIVASGDHRASLEALRDELARGMEQADANVKPQYAARLQAVLSELAALPTGRESTLDELRARRTNSARAAADAGKSPQRRSRSRSARS